MADESKPSGSSSEGVAVNEYRMLDEWGPAPTIFVDGGIGMLADSKGTVKFNLYQDFSGTAPGEATRRVAVRLIMHRHVMGELAVWMMNNLRAIDTSPLLNEGTGDAPDAPK